MSTPQGTVECASIPAEALPALAGLRREPGLTVRIEADRAWLHWCGASESILRRVLPIRGAELYTKREGHWYRLGHRLPSFGLPVDGPDLKPIDRVLVPVPMVPVPPHDTPITRQILRLVRDGRPRPATALECPLDALSPWVESAPSADFAPLRAAIAGDRVLLLGSPLPPVTAGIRFWGERVLIPLGFRPEPDLPLPALLDLLAPETKDRVDGVVLLSEQGAERVPAGAFGPVRRASFRLARRQVAPREEGPS